MEGKRSLPVLQERGTPTIKQGDPSIRMENQGERVEIKIAKAFLQQRYPLAQEGEILRQQVRTALEEQDEATLDKLALLLPTVEQPNLHLFQELAVEPSQRDIFEEHLANVQVTKGCRHDCTFCAASAEHKVEMMPFVAVLKIAEKKQVFDHELMEMRDRWEGEFKELKLTPERLFRHIDANLERLGAAIEHLNLGKGMMRQWLFYRREWQAIKAAGKVDGKIISFLFSVQQEIVYQDPALMFERGVDFLRMANDLSRMVLLKFKQTPLAKYVMMASENRSSDDDLEDTMIALDLAHGRPLQGITNYYDSDPFDYRDSTFLHKDGTPADFGDAFVALSSPIRPIHITTAGWPVRDAAANRAAEKIIEACRHEPMLIDQPRVSINPFEATARRDLVRYRENILHALEMLRPVKPLALLFHEGDDSMSPYEREVLEPVKNYLAIHRDEKGLVPGKWRHTDVMKSFFSGPMSTEGDKERDHDVMACMQGFHIWPDGTVQQQGIGYVPGEKIEPKNGRRIEKGSRPVAIGVRLYTPNPKGGI